MAVRHTALTITASFIMRFSFAEQQVLVRLCSVTNRFLRLNVLAFRPILAGMAKKPEPPPQLIAWSIYEIADKRTWVGTIDAPDEATAIEKASAEFMIPAMRLHAVRQR